MLRFNTFSNSTAKLGPLNSQYRQICSHIFYIYNDGIGRHNTNSMPIKEAHQQECTKSLWKIERVNIMFTLSGYFHEPIVTFFRLLFTNNLICTPTKVEQIFPTMKVVSTRYFIRRTSQTWIVTKWISHDATISIYITDCKESGDKAVSFFVVFIHSSVFFLPSSDSIARPFNCFGSIGYLYLEGWFSTSWRPFIRKGRRSHFVTALDFCRIHKWFNTGWF